MSRRIVSIPALAAASIVLSAPALAQSHVVQLTPTTPSVAIIAPTIYGDDSILPAYVTAYPDPAWKVCQIDEPRQRDRYYYCGPYSYHPYGINGYRPFGTYGVQRVTPVPTSRPSAKIITVQPQTPAQPQR